MEATMNDEITGRLLILGIAAVLAGTTPFAAAQFLFEGRTAQDRRFLAGGVGLDESEQMKAAAREFPLTVVVATKSGAYLADTHIRIADATGRTVLDAQLDSPYLLVDLTQGRYRVEATHEGEKRQQTVEIAANTRARLVFSFDVPG
jgi:hypothetical protein